MRGVQVSIFSILGALLALPLAHAQMVQRVFGSFWSISQNTTVIFALSFLLVFMLFYAIFAAGLAKV